MKHCSKCGTFADTFYADKRAADGLQSQCKTCMRAGFQSAYLKNRDARLSDMRAKYAAAPGAKIESATAYYAAHAGAVKLNAKKYRTANRDRIATHRRAARIADPIGTKSRDRAMYLKNPSAYKSRASARRMRLVGAPGYTSGDVDRLLKLQRGRCACCRVKLRGFEVDHVHPLALGGEHSALNIQLLCRPCNREKHAKHPVKFMQSKGFLL